MTARERRAQALPTVKKPARPQRETLGDPHDASSDTKTALCRTSLGRIASQNKPALIARTRHPIAA
jgi:hypothetical protein